MSASRVLIFSLSYYPDLIGGAEVAVKEITDRIHPQEIEFHMVTLRTRRKEARVEKIGNVFVHRIGFAATKGPLMSFNKHAYIFLAPLRASRLHAAHAFGSTWSIMANYAGAAALFFKLFHMDVPFLLTLQEGDPIGYILGLKRVRPFMRIFRMVFSYADKVQAISNYLADFARSMGALGEVVVIPNGVDVQAFSKPVSASRIDEIRRESGFERDDVVLVTASRLVEKNAVDDAISSLRHLPPQTKLLILGAGRLEESLRQQARDAGLDGRVVFKGYVPHAELPAYLQASDVFVRPSLSEGFGNSFIEAMAAGLPVVATPVGGIVDFLKDKETGLFCAVKDPEDLARKVEIYLHDAALREEIVENARAMARERYDWSFIAKDMRDRAFDILSS